MLRLAADENVHGDVIRGLRQRLPELDLMRAQDVDPRPALAGRPGEAGPGHEKAGPTPTAAQGC